MEKTIEVVAALIWRGERFLACRRPADKPRGNLWEFAGGKVESGETMEEALVRECREELYVTVVPKKIFAEVTHKYPDVTVHLTVFECALEEGEPRRLVHSALRWLTPAQLPRYKFCPADKEILEKLSQL